MSEYIDEVFEADCPQYVDFNEPQPLQDNADEWFNYDHENDIPVEFSSPEHMDSTSATDDETVPPAPIEMEDLTAPSPAPVVVVKQKAEVHVIPVVQNNLELINISSESTTPVKPETVLTVEKAKTPSPQTPPAHQTITADTTAVESDEEQFEDARSDDEQPKMDTKEISSSVKPVLTAKKTIPAKKQPLVNTVLPNNSKVDRPDENKSKLVRSNSLRRTTRSVGGITPLRSRSQKRRSAVPTATKRTASADSTSKRTTSADPVPIKRKRHSSPVRTSQPVQRPKLTMPHTPRVLSRNRSGGQSKFKSSEEMEMERIEQARRETKKAMEISKKSKQLAMESVSYHPVRSAVEPTRPEEFKFETDSRLKEHHMETRQEGSNRNFESGLRKHKASPKKARGPTVTKPFHFSEAHHRHNGGAASGKGGKFKPMASMAQAISRFHSKTPDRFRTKSTKDANKGPCPVKAVHTKPALTCPMTPLFETKSRKRPITVISQAEKDELEYKEMKSYSFRARSIDPRVMSNVNMGVTKPQQKESTKAVGFDLECDKRFKEREANKKPQEEEKHEFHARPLSSKIMEGPTGIAPAKPMPVTCPKSPAFALKNRVRITRSNTHQVEEEVPKILHANPIPHMGVPFIPNLNHKVTEAKPFSFENRDKMTLARKEAKIQEVLNEEKELHNKFRAQQLPTNVEDRSTKLPQKKRRSNTIQVPFTSVEERGAKQAEQWSKKMEEELNEQRRLATKFKAKQAAVLYEDPFVPQKSTKPLTDVSDFRLNTDRRSVQRQDFEEKKHVREANLRVASEERQKQIEEEEREAIARLRREMEHRANPIRNFTKIQVLPSDRPLTQPESPQFATNMRLRSQNPRL